MVKVVGVRFRSAGKIYFFDPDNFEIHENDGVIVETARGMEFGTVTGEIQEITEEEIVAPLKKVIRLAEESDYIKHAENLAKKERTMAICQEKVEKHGLDMKLVDVEYTFDRSKILFCFTSDGRVDFRELVKDLAGVFRTRIELRQIGIRDESKKLGGLGICGRPFCCGTFLGSFQPVTIKMAKEQGLSLSPSKISGTCGRLMCCLKYEQASYDHLLRHTPKVGAIVDTAEGRGTVVENNLLTGMLKVKLEKRPESAPFVVERHEVKLIKDGQIRVNKEEMEALKNLE